MHNVVAPSYWCFQIWPILLTFPLLNKIIQHLSEEDGCNDVRLLHLLKQEKIARITLAPSLRFVNITICSTPSCQTIDQKSTSVFDVGPVCIKGEKNERTMNNNSAWVLYMAILIKINKPWHAMYWFSFFRPLKIIMT